MKTKTKFLTTKLTAWAVVLLVLLSPVGSPKAEAQWAVFDAPHLAQTILNYWQMIEEYKRQGEELVKAVEQVDAMTGDRGMQELFNSLLEVEKRRYSAETWDEMLDLLKSEDIPEHLARVLEIYEEMEEVYQVIEREDFNPFNPDAPNALAFENRTDTNRAAVAIAEASYDKTYERMAVTEELIYALAGAEDVKASSDLQVRVAAQNGIALNELIRLISVNMQQEAALETDRQVGETNFRRQIQFEDKTLEDMEGGS